MQVEDFYFEIKRKTFHLYALIVPLFYVFVSKMTISIILFLVTLAVLYFDIFRHYTSKINEFIAKIFSKIMRPEESNGTHRLSGMSFMMLGFLITAIFFSKGLAICSWCILIISDCLAALIGIKIGEKLDNGKSLAGSMAFFISAIFIGMLIYFIVGYNTSFFIIIISSLVTTVGEFYAKQLGINDNLLIPLSYCFSTVIFTLLL